MAFPNRMATSLFRIRLQRTGAAQYIDPVFGGKLRPLEDQFDAALEMRGQPRFKRNQHETAKLTGDAEQTSAYITVSYLELRRHNVSADQLKNARVTGFFRDGAWVACDFLVKRVDPRGHLMGGPVIVQMRLEAFGDSDGSA